MNTTQKNSFPVQAKGGNTPKVPKPEITPPPQKKPGTGKVTPTKSIKPKGKVAVVNQKQ